MKENDNEKSLMRKTKKELIDIILRKDDVEIRLKDTIKSKDEEIESLNSRIIGYDSDINGFSKMLDENASYQAELKEVIARKSKNLRVWQIVAVVAVIAAIVIAAILA